MWSCRCNCLGWQINTAASAACLLMLRDIGIADRVSFAVAGLTARQGFLFHPSCKRNESDKHAISMDAAAGKASPLQCLHGSTAGQQQCMRGAQMHLSAMGLVQSMLRHEPVPDNKHRRLHAAAADIHMSDRRAAPCRTVCMQQQLCTSHMHARMSGFRAAPCRNLARTQ